MNKNTIFILSLFAVILGILVSVFWFFIGSFFVSGIIAGIMESLNEEEIPLTISNLTPGMIIVGIQNILSIVLLIIATVIAWPSRLYKNLRRNGILLIVLGVAILIINLLQFISTLLLIIGGIIAFKRIPSENEG